jgi:hypothetical protein
LQNRPRSQALAWPLSLHPSPSYSLCPMQLDTRGGGEPEATLPRSHSPLSLTLATSNPQPASSHRPGDAPGPHLQAPHPPYLTIPSPFRQCRPGHARWRLGLRPHASVRSRASGRPDTPHPSPNP